MGDAPPPLTSVPGCTPLSRTIPLLPNPREVVNLGDNTLYFQSHVVLCGSVSLPRVLSDSMVLAL